MNHTIADRNCDHGLKCVIYTSRKQPGRQFYRCPKPIDDPQRCNFFLWLDEAQPLSPQAGPQLPPTPESAPPSFSAYHDPPPTPTPSSRKRDFTSIADETFGSASSPSQKRAKRYDEEGRFPSGNFLHNPDIGSQCTQETFTGEEEELSASSIETLLKSLGNIPAYVKKLEKRKIAAEKSRDAKANKIVSLTAEVERLKQREKELEELVAILESE